MSSQLEVMTTIKSSRLNVPWGIDRSQYYTTVKDTTSKAISLYHAKNSNDVLVSAVVILASLTNSYTEGSTGFSTAAAVCGQTVRYAAIA